MSHGLNMRARHNRGMVRKEMRSQGAVWVFRWSERIDGQRHHYKEVLGSVKDLPTLSAAEKAAEPLRLKLNENKEQLKPITFGRLINHYLEHELVDRDKSTQVGNKSYIKNWIEPAWSAKLAREMKTMQIEAWLHSIERPNGTKQKIKNILSTIFSHGVRWELVDRNPVCGQGGTPGRRGASTGVRQGGKSSIERIVLPPEVVREVLLQLPLRATVLAVVDVVTALRASELMGLQWRDVQWDTASLKSERAVVLGEIKGTKSRDNDLPLAQPVLQLLRLWRRHTPYRAETDWIFASPFYHGRMPYTPQILFRRHIRPIIERVAGIKSTKQAPIGWHTLRRSLATLMISNGENIKVVQGQLRHTTPKITLELYAQAVSGDQHRAHNRVVKKVLPPGLPKRLEAVARGLTGKQKAAGGEAPTAYGV